MDNRVGRLAIAFMLIGLPAPSAALAQNPQQRFEAASTAAGEGRCAEGVAAFEALEATDSVRNNPAVRATIAARKAGCLVSLGRGKEVAAAARIALAGLSETSALGRVDLALTHLAVGRFALEEFNYGEARRSFSEARRLAGEDILLPLMWLAKATTFDGDGVAIDAAARAVKLAEAASGTDKKSLSVVKAVYARALLNQGQVPAAYTELKDVLRLRGGLTLNVNVDDVVMRSDLALAALLTKDNDKAREYLAYTGAGLFADSPFTSAINMEAPPCGGEAGLKPEDRAIVEFSIDDQGSVDSAQTVYVSRPGAEIAAAFGKAVKTWYWMPQSLAKIGPVFRAATRVELRCSTAAARPPVMSLAYDELKAWLIERKVPEFESEETGATLLSSARKELARRQAGGGGLSLVPVQMELLRSPFVKPQEKEQVLAETMKLLADAGAPILVRIPLEAMNAPDRPGASPKHMEGLLTRADIADDARASALVRILLADRPKEQASRKIAFLGPVANDARLPDGDPYKVGALVRLANLEARAGRLDVAQAHFSRTGLDAQQCALADARPAQKPGDFSSQYPLEALKWGFEGWALVEYDIQADGRTANQRPMIAYPPLVFNEASTGIVKAVRYESTFRPSGILGCGGASNRVIFNIPRK